MTVKHILVECLDFSVIRKKYFRVRTLKDLFDVVDPIRIVYLVKEIGLFRRL